MKNNNLVIGLVLLGVIAIGGFIFLRPSDDATENSTMTTSTPTPSANEEMTVEQESMTIVEIAAGNPDFSILVDLVTQAGLVDTLSSDGPFTVFAPTNDAFNKLDEATLNAVATDKDLLTKVLTYHVVSGKVMSEDVVNLTSATTVQGGDVEITADETGVKINDAKVIAADIEASNGVIHVIDTVLIPE